MRITSTPALRGFVAVHSSPRYPRVVLKEFLVNALNSDDRRPGLFRHECHLGITTAGDLEFIRIGLNEDGSQLPLLRFNRPMPRASISYLRALLQAGAKRDSDIQHWRNSRYATLLRGLKKGLPSTTRWAVVPCLSMWGPEVPLGVCSLPCTTTAVDISRKNPAKRCTMQLLFT